MASNLHPDILGCICSKLSSLKHRIRFGCVCKQWLSTTGRIRSHHVSLPLLLHMDDDDNDNCFLHSPWLQKTFMIRIPQLRGIKGKDIKYVDKQGRMLVASRSSIFVFSLFGVEGVERMELPKLPWKEKIGGVFVIGFATSATTGSISKVIYVNAWDDIFIVGMWPVGDNRCWRSFIGNNYLLRFKPSSSSPVLLNGLFYVLGEDGRLGYVYAKDEDFPHWTELPYPTRVRLDPQLSALEPKNRHSHLVEFEGELYSVFISAAFNDDGLVNMFKLNSTHMSWMKINHLENCNLFVSPTQALVRRNNTSDDLSKFGANIVYHSMVDDGFVKSSSIPAQMGVSEDHFYFVQEREKNEESTIVRKVSANNTWVNVVS